MKERLLKYLKIAGITLVILLIIIEIISFAIGANIKKIIISQINSQLTVPVKIDGDVDFSLLEHFPYASVTFKKVDIAGSLPTEEKHLLKADEVYLLFSIWNLFEKNYTAHRIAFKNGEVNIIYNDKGKSNFDIFKTDTTHKSNSSFHISKLLLDNIALTYLDRQNHYDLAFNVKTGTLSGTITGDDFQFTTDIDAFCKGITIENDTYIKDRNITLKSDLDYNSSTEKLIVKSATTNIEDNAFDIKGTVQSFANYTELELAFNGKDLNLVSFASILPSSQSKYISAYHSKGEFSLAGKITGNSSSSTNPAVDIAFSVKDGQLKNDNIDKAFKDISFSGELVTGSSLDFHEAHLGLNRLSATLDGQLITGNLRLDNFSQPTIDLQLNASIDLKNIFPLFELNFVKEMYGEVDFQNVYYKGPLDKLSGKGSLKNIDAGGTILIKNVTIVFDRNHLNHIDGAFKINNNATAVNQLRIRSGTTDMTFSGSITNAISAVFNSFRKKTQRTRVEVNIACTSPNINWSDLEVPSQPSKSSSKQTDSIHFLPAFLNTFEGNISANIDHFTYEKFAAKNINGVVEVHPEKIFFNNISFASCNGSFFGSGALTTDDPKNVTLETTDQLKDIDINNLFYVFNNFGQNDITDKNLGGDLTTQLFIHAVWTNYNLDEKKLHVVSDVDIKNGELVNYEPMNALSAFVKIKELKDIHFSELQNQIEIKDRVINIPDMTIHSTALNLEISGTQTFDNIIDYKIKLNLLELLGNKFRKSNPNPENSDKDVNGALNLYLVMTGPASNPTIKYDKQAVKKKIKEGMQEQKKELKSALDNEFSQQKKVQNNAKDWQPEQQPQFIEFNDTTTETPAPALQEDTASQQTDTTSTKYKQKKAFQDFKKKLFHKPPPPNN